MSAVIRAYHPTTLLALCMSLCGTRPSHRLLTTHHPTSLRRNPSIPPPCISVDAILPSLTPLQLGVLAPRLPTAPLACGTARLLEALLVHVAAGPIVVVLCTTHSRKADLLEGAATADTADTDARRGVIDRVDRLFCHGVNVQAICGRGYGRSTHGTRSEVWSVTDAFGRRPYCLARGFNLGVHRLWFPTHHSPNNPTHSPHSTPSHPHSTWSVDFSQGWALWAHLLSSQCRLGSRTP